MTGRSTFTPREAQALLLETVLEVDERAQYAMRRIKAIHGI